MAKSKIYDATATGSTTPRDIRDRFADVVNVKDFGAIGDGITDDTAAFEAAAAVANGRYIYVPFGNYKITAAVPGLFYSDGDTVLPHEYITFRNSAFAGNVRAVYVSNDVGDDLNDGMSPSTPIKTIGRAFSIMNSGTHAQYSFYLMGNSVYEVPSDVFVIGQSCPHFYNVDGSPTILFTYTGGVGPRFYAGHIAFNGNEDYRLNIDAEFGSIYFEGCAVGAREVNFRVPITSVGGSFWSENIGLTSDAEKYAFTVVYGNARFTGSTDIMRKDAANLRAINASNASVLAIYGSVNFTDATLGAIGNFININHSVFFGSFNSDQFTVTNVESANLLYLEESIVTLDKALYFAACDVGFIDYRSSISVDGLDISNQYINGTYSLGTIRYCPGCITTGSKYIMFTIPLTKSIFPEATVSLSFEKLSVRGVSGYILSNATPDSINYSVRIAEGSLYCEIVLAEAHATANNTPVDVQLSNAVITVTP